MKRNKFYTALCIALSITVLGFTRTVMQAKNSSRGSDTSTTDTTMKNNVTTAAGSATNDPNSGTTTSSTVMNPTAPTDFTVPATTGSSTSSDYPTTDGQKPINSYTIATPESTST